MTLQNSNDGFLLRKQPLAPRLVISAFLLAVGFGYFSALVQLHFQHASAGQLIPGPDEVKAVYANNPGIGQLERLIQADENRPFNGSGSMRSAFTFRSAGWKARIKEVSGKMKISRDEAERELHKLRQFEINAVLAWLRDGAKEPGWDQFVLSDSFFDNHPQDPPPDDRFFEKDEKTGKWTARISKLFEDRCERCHAPGKGGSAGQIHLDNWNNVTHYVPPDNDAPGGAMSLTKLAQTTHVHLLGFSMLYGLTGLVFAFTSYPLFLRILLAPLPILAQVAEISCWWLARLDPLFILGIMGLGALTGVCLFLQITMSLLDMYEKKGKLVVACIGLLAGGVGLMVHLQFLAPHLAAQKAASGL